ncbi:CHASE3 domain-containing protein [Cohnella herbarum]|uniref:histidine kinase n=1 Tax=Cohnella herbarum TaxID=2728023 RepID=A0A7Z2ZK87_9BACL|nr:CHASE3 domain-containing protein [Cohnella herbarum]QJD82703.1 GAF domain-containing protein [Cohnella herbarum]
MFNTRFSIRSKIVLGYLVIIICLGLSIFILSDRIDSMDKEIKFITNHDIEVHNLSNQIEKQVLDMVSGHRGYIISGEERYLDPYTMAKEMWVADYKQLFQLVTDNPSQQTNLDAIKTNIEQWIETMGEPIIALKNENKEQEILSLYKADTGKVILDRISSQLNDFRMIEKALTQQRSDILNQRNADLKVVLFLILLIVTVISLVVSYVISGTIVKSIKQVAKTIVDIASAEGNLSARRIVITTRDEIQDLGEATNQLLQSHESQNWLQTGIAEVGTAFQGHSQISELAQSAITKLAYLLNVSHGVFYRRSEDNLTMIASFAASGDVHSIAGFRIGEGIVGQAALEKRTFLLHSVPENHIKITTGLGQSSPKSILIVPIAFEGKIKGVIELASLEAFTPLQQQLVEQTSKTLGIAMNSVVTQMEVQRLLEDSQALSEELQAQTEELQQQAEELQAQSEELIAQQDELKASNDSLKLSEERLKRQQEQLLLSNQETEEKNEQVEIQNAVLEKQKAELISATRYKSEFLANMSHELRTPLNSLLILSQLLADNIEGNLHPKQIDFAKTIHTSGSDLLRLIDEILDLSKVESGQMIVEMEPVFLEEIKDSLWGVFQPMANDKGIDFHIHLEQSLPEAIYTDGHRLRQT